MFDISSSGRATRREREVMMSLEAAIIRVGEVLDEVSVKDGRWKLFG